MSSKTKISPAFEPFMAETKANDKRDAIVIFKTPPRDDTRPRGRLRSLKQRLDFVKERASLQQPLQAKALKTYKESSAKRLRSSDRPLIARPIGSAAMPAAHVEVTRKTLPDLAGQDDVVAILPNQRINLIEPKRIGEAELARRERDKGMTWGLESLEIPELWATTKGKGINVAVLDTGVYGDHPALAGRVKKFIVVDPLGRQVAASPSFDGGQHGTHVCGTVAGGKTADGVSIGVAPEANLLAAGVLIGDATLRTLIEGISWAIDEGADIINMSLGFTYYEPLFAEVFDMLLNTFGILPVCAVGNENHGNTSSPGNVYNAFSVGAAEKIRVGRHDVAFFSSGASLLFPDSIPELVHKPDVVAPGVEVFSAVPPERTPSGIIEYAYFDGSSMATPHVAGVAALLMAAKPSASVKEVMAVMRDTAKHPGGETKRPDNRWGFGMVQPKEALAALA